MERQTPSSETAGKPQTSGVQVPPPLYYVAAFLVGVGLELAFPIDSPPAAMRVVVTVLGVLAWAILDGAAMYAFMRAKTSMPPMRPSTTLVTSGPYRLTRNPMYLGMACLYIALSFALGVIWALALLPLVILAIDRLVIAREEPYLKRTFGDPYREYRARVRRWL
ncbi:MAG: methyltransferase family protein [Solirubrobacterales bacterium]